MTETTIKKLEMAILTGEMKPRERLVESELISKFNVKRFAVRKAIHELAHRGFVEVVPNKGRAGGRHLGQGSGRHLSRSE